MEIQEQSFKNKRWFQYQHQSYLHINLTGIYEENVCIPVVQDKQEAGQTHDQLQSPPGGQEVSQTRQDDHAHAVESPTHHGHKFSVFGSKELYHCNEKDTFS